MLPPLGRRALLSLAATPAHPAMPGLGQFRLGANLERWFPVVRSNHPRRLGRGWWREFRAAGFDHARLIIPEIAQTGAGPEVPLLYAEAVADALAAGVGIILALADFWHEGAPWGEREWLALRSRAGLLAPRLDPARVVLAPLNEPAFATAAAWVPVRDRLLGTLRAAAPGHLLMWGGHGWCSAPSLLEATPPADPWTIAEVHDYQGGSPAAIAARFGQVAAWRDRHGVPVLVSELGGAMGHATDRAAWADDLARLLPGLAALRLPATLWCYTHGGWWRMQEADGPAPWPGLLPRG